MTIRTTLFSAAWTALLALLVGSGCSSALELDNSEQSPTHRAKQQLSAHEVEEAQSLYAEALTEDPTLGDAAAGKAVTDLLIVIEAASLEGFWVDFLAARRAPDADALLYRDDGMFYWMSRGVPWEDDGDYAGLKSLVADRLPWPADRLDSLHAFTRGLDTSTGEGIDDLVGLADALAQVEDQLQIAIDDDRFQTFVIPGEVFHADDVDVVLGRAELAALSALISTFRGVVYFNAAYAHDWTPEDAVVGTDERQERLDHAAGYLDPRLYRRVDDAERLEDARDTLASASRSLRESMRAGESTQRKTALNWRTLTDAEREQLGALLTSFEESLYGRTAIPYSAPATTMDLSVFFEGGRTLAREDPAGEPLYWLAPMSPEDDLSDEFVSGWKLNDAALQAVFVDGVFEPSFDVGSSDAPELHVSGNVKDDLASTVAGELNRDVQKTY